MKLRIALPVILLCAALLFLPILSHDFTDYDDTQTIAANPQLHPPTPASLQQIWTQSAEGLYVPVTYTAWWLTAFLLPRDAPLPAWPFHLLSLLCHATASGLVLLILRRFSLRPWAALLGALLFAVHPVQVESVAWASGTKDLLGGVCVFAGLLAWLRYRETGTWKLYTLFLVALVVGMLCKPSVVVLPLIAVVIDRTVRNQTWRQSVQSLWLPLLLTIPCLMWSRAVQRSWPELEVPLVRRPLIAVDAIAFYLHKVVWPANLSINYGLTPAAVLRKGDDHFAICTAIVLMAIALANMIRRLKFGRRGGTACRCGLGLAIFACGLLPVLGLTPFEFQIHSTVADHYLYVPMLGVALIAALLIDGIASRTLAIALIMTLAGRTLLQERVWQDSVTLLTHAVSLSPDSIDLRGGLGTALAVKGRVQEALPHFEWVVQRVPTAPIGHERLAQAYLSLYRFDDARQQAQRAVDLAAPPRFDAAWPRYLLGEAYAGLGQTDRALEQLRIADQLRPGDALFTHRLAELQKQSP